MAGRVCGWLLPRTVAVHTARTASRLTRANLRSLSSSSSSSSSALHFRAARGSSRWPLAVAAGAAAAFALGARRAYAQGSAAAVQSTHIARVMLPDDANPSIRNVHGGTILKMVDEAGSIAATRFANSAKNGPPVVCALARIEHMDFVYPIYVGEVAHLDARVTYSSNHSIETEVCVWAENPVTGEQRVTNKARCWYVATSIEGLTGKANGESSRLSAAQVPQCTHLSEEEQRKGAERYELQKEARSKRPANLTEEEPFGPPTLMHLVLPGDCNAAGLAQAGTIMKLMDNVAGITAARHCRTNVVTVSLDSMDFYRPVKNGNIVSLHARPTFTSNKSMEIEVEVYAEDLNGKHLANRSNFVFVSLDKQGHTMKVPPLKVKTPEDKMRYQQGYLRYVSRKTSPREPVCCKIPNVESAPPSQETPSPPPNSDKQQQ